MSVSIRTSLLRNLVAMVVVMGVAIVATTYLGSGQAVTLLSESILSKSRETIEARLHDYFNDAALQLHVLHDYGAQGLLDQVPEADAGALGDLRDRLLGPVIERSRQISSIMIADDRGREHMLLHFDGRWRSRQTRLDEWGGEVRWIEWADGEAPAPRRETLDYDPRIRPWFRGALAGGGVHWTDPYVFFTVDQPGITASLTYDLGDGSKRVIGVDILLSAITSFTQDLRVGRRGLVAVLTDDGRVIGLPRDPRFRDPRARAAALLEAPAALGLEPVVDAAAALGAGAATSSRFSSGGEAWWGQVAPFHLSPEDRLWIAVVVPQRELLGHLAVQRAVLFAIIVLVLVVGVGRAVFLARRFSAPIEALVAESDRMSQGDLEPRPPVASDVTEFQRLAAAHQQLREGMAALLRLEQVERELSLARDIQQGLLPGGPPSAGTLDIAGWNQPADLTGGDYYDWFILPDGQVVVTVADVTGHGVGPALIVAICRAYLRAATLFGGVNLAKALADVNDLLYEDTPPERFVTMAACEVDPKRNRVTLVSAGHGPILYYHAGDGTVESWAADVPPLGVMSGLEFPAPRRFTLHGGDVLLLTTDGFFEWQDPGGKMYGTSRLESFLAARHGLGAKAMIDALYDEVIAHAAGTPQADDLTAVVVRRP